MRAVKKGTAPNIYTDYKDAVNDLANAIDWYCSYCEMPVKNMIEIEHVIPQHKGGQKLDWNNFLLSCKYCNTVKKARNLNRNDYLFPDEDNTSIAFLYSRSKTIEPQNNLQAAITQFAQNTIDLCGLDRFPGNSKNKPTKSDKRWISRDEVWAIAEKSLKDCLKYPTNKPLIDKTIELAAASGHYSIWIEVFKNMPKFKKKLDKIIKGTYTTSYDKNGNPKKRKGSKI